MKYSIKPFLTLLILFTIVHFTSCRKIYDKEIIPKAEIKDPIFPTTIEEKKTVQDIFSVTEIIKKVYAANPNAIAEVNDLIKIGYYNDEFILLSDLLKYETSLIYQSPKTRNIKNKGEFKKEFIKAIGINSSNAQARTTLEYLTDYQNGVITIYYPYSDKFTGTTASITVVPADRDADEAPGYILKSGKWINASAGDLYSQTNPCHLIGVTSTDFTPAPDNIYRTTDPNVLPDAARCGIIFTGTQEKQLPAPPIYPGNLPNIIKVFIGYSRCVYQFDRWISFTGNGGGSEIMYSRGDGYLKFANSHVTDFQDLTTVYHTRSDIRDKKALFVAAPWDNQWENNDTEQYYAIWEQDNKGSVNFKFSLATTVNTGTGQGPGSISFDINKTSQDAIVDQKTITRQSYLTDARDQSKHGHGYLVGFDLAWTSLCSIKLTYKYDYLFLDKVKDCPWPKRNWADASRVGWTWPYSIY